MPTINPQIGARHEATSIAQHEEHRCAKFVHCAQPEQHVVAHPLALHPGLLKCFRCRGGANITGGERIDSDQRYINPGAPFCSQRTRQLVNGRFGCIITSGIDALVRVNLSGEDATDGVNTRAHLVRCVSTHARYQNHAARNVLLDHFPGRCLRNEECARDVDVQHPAERRHRELG